MTQDVVFSQVANALPMLLAAADTIWRFLGETGSVMSLGMAGLGSAIGIGIAGQAAAGAWAKEARAGRNLSFTYIILVGMPISQTLYAMIVMVNMRGVFANAEVAMADSGLLMGVGLATGTGRNALGLDAGPGRSGRHPRPQRRRRQGPGLHHHRHGHRRDGRYLRDGLPARHDSRGVDSLEESLQEEV